MTFPGVLAAEVWLHQDFFHVLKIIVQIIYSIKNTCNNCQIIKSLRI